MIGSVRPPTFADLPSLPYIRAIVKETLRWSSTAPFGLPHASTEDDWYEGTFIPKGTICLLNMRVLKFNTEMYGSDAAEFDPARYLDEVGRVVLVEEGRGEGHFAFGLGRRMCPGKFVAEGTSRLIFRHFGRCDSCALKARCASWTCAPSSTLVYLRTRFLFALSTGLVLATAWHSHHRPFEYKAIPRLTEAEGLLNEALNLYT